jgi:hypothetical protein
VAVLATDGTATATTTAKVTGLRFRRFKEGEEGLFGSVCLAKDGSSVHCLTTFSFPTLISVGVVRTCETRPKHLSSSPNKTLLHCSCHLSHRFFIVVRQTFVRRFFVCCEEKAKINFFSLF